MGHDAALIEGALDRVADPTRRDIGSGQPDGHRWNSVPTPVLATTRQRSAPSGVSGP